MDDPPLSPKKYTQFTVPINAGTAPPVAPLPPVSSPTSATSKIIHPPVFVPPSSWALNRTASSSTIATVDSKLSTTTIESSKKKRFSFFNMFSSSRSNSTVKPSPLAEPTTLDEHEHTEEPEELMESDRASIASIVQEIQLDPEPIPAIHEPPASPVEPPTESAFSPDEDHFLAQQPAFPLEGTVKMVPKPSILATADLFAGDVGNTVKRAGSTRTNELEGTIRQPRRASSFWRLFKEREAENGMAESFAETDDRRVTVVMPDDVYVDALSETPQQEEPSVMMFDPNLNIGTIGKGMGRKLSSRHQQTLTDTFTESPVQTQPPPNAFVAENDSYGTVRKRGATVPVDSRTVLSTPKIQLYPNFHADASAQDPKFHETDDEEDALESEAKAAEEIITEARAKDTARNIYDETNMPAKREEICEWLGKNDEWRQRVLRNYLDCFEFGGMRLDEAFRRFTGHLYLKGETQLIDRILVQFARRFYDCNRNGLFDNQDVVYGVAYSLLLLNTDLHVAQNNTKMSRSTFVRNTLATITAYTNVDVKVSEDTQKRQSLDTRSFSVDTRSISSKSVGSDKSGKNDLATMLKEMYNSIKQHSLQKPRGIQTQITRSVSTDANNLKSPGRTSLSRSRSITTLRRISSFTLAPTMTASTPNIHSPPRQLTSPNSVNNFWPSDASSGQSSPIGRKKSNVSVAATSQYSDMTASSSINDSGSIPPSPTLRPIFNLEKPVEWDDSTIVYTKAGVLARKHLFERSDKKAPNRSWKEVYTVVDRGEIKMYKVDRNLMAPDGSELLDVAMQLGNVSLRHSLSVPLPPPGYSVSRPHVFAVQLPNGGVYLFQAASGELVRDWVTSCNYWAARESKEPLPGGIDNREYGWGRPNLHAEEGEARTSIDYARETVIAEWTPPQPPMVRSAVDDNAQLRALLMHIASLENQLLTHKELRENVDRWPAKSLQHTRAFSNWERKSQHLLKELIKYQTYADCIKQALIARHRKENQE